MVIGCKTKETSQWFVNVNSDFHFSIFIETEDRFLINSGPSMKNTFDIAN